MALRIEDYALIGDCRAAALVGRDGSIDWLCWPRFDSAACFAALLGTSDNGRWLLAPSSQPLEVTRRYRPGTLILETEFRTETGRRPAGDPPTAESHQSPHRSEGGARRRSLAQLMGPRAGYEDRR